MLLDDGFFFQDLKGPKLVLVSCNPCCLTSQLETLIFFATRFQKAASGRICSDFSGTWSWGFNHLKAVASHRSCSRCIPSFKRQGEAEAPPRGRSRWCSRWRSSLGRTSPERHNPQIKNDKTRTSHQPFNRWGLDGHWVLHFGLLVDVHHLAPGLVPGWDSLPQPSTAFHSLSSLSCASFQLSPLSKLSKVPVGLRAKDLHPGTLLGSDPGGLLLLAGSLQTLLCC